MRVRNALAFATHAFFQGRGFYYVHTPIITASDCEGAGEMFAVRAAQGAAGGTPTPSLPLKGATLVSPILHAPATPSSPCPAPRPPAPPLPPPPPR